MAATKKLTKVEEEKKTRDMFCGWLVDPGVKERSIEAINIHLKDLSNLELEAIKSAIFELYKIRKNNQDE